MKNGILYGCLLLSFVAMSLSMELEDDAEFTDQQIYDWKNTAKYIARNPAYVHAKNKYGRTVLYEAVHAPYNLQASGDVLELLIKNKADVNSQDMYLNTPLHEAIHGEHYVNALILLQNGAKILQNSRKKTALHMIFNTPIDEECANKRVELIQAIIKRDPHCINLQDEDKATALHYAIRDDHVTGKEIQLLLQLGSNATIPDQHGETAYDLAKKCGRENVLKSNNDTIIYGSALIVLIAAAISYYFH